MRPLELAQNSGRRVYLCLHNAVVATSVKKWWENASAVRPETDANMVMTGFLIHLSRYSSVRKRKPPAPSDNGSRCDSRALVRTIVLDYCPY